MQSQSEFLTLRDHLQKVIVGQHKLLDRLMISMLTGGHVLLEGVPGLAKTTAVNTLANGLHASFQRIQLELLSINLIMIINSMPLLELDFT